MLCLHLAVWSPFATERYLDVLPQQSLSSMLSHVVMLTGCLGTCQASMPGRTALAIQLLL